LVLTLSSRERREKLVGTVSDDPFRKGEIRIQSLNSKLKLLGLKY